MEVGVFAPVEASGMVAGGKHVALHAVAPRGLEHVVAADDVRLQDRFPRAFDRVAAEVHDGVDALGDAQAVGHLRNIRLDEVLCLQGAPVRKPQLVLPRQLASEMRADVAGGAGDQNGLQRILPMISLNFSARSKYTECPAAGTRTALPLRARRASAGPAAGGKTQSSSPVTNSTGIGNCSSSFGDFVRSSRMRPRTSSRKAAEASSEICP